MTEIKGKRPKTVKPDGVKTGGRHHVEIDWNLLENACLIQCTQIEIEALMGLEFDTIEAACQRVKRCSFSTFYKKHSSKGKSSLRRLQWKKAHDGNVPMQIWLGKNLLNQSDKTNTVITGQDGRPIQQEIKIIVEGV